LDQTLVLENMNLKELRITTYIYEQFSQYDENYFNLKDVDFTFSNKEEVEKLYQFLRDWQCRQFKKPTSKKSLNAFLKWYLTYKLEFPSKNKSLLDLSDKKLLDFAPMFQSLMDCHASTRVSNKNDKVRVVSFGPVGAAKALFAIRKNAFAPWDNFIIDKLNELQSYPDAPISKDGIGYSHYMIFVKRQLLSLAKEVNDIQKLPKILNRPFSSLPKIIDEHLWVSITRGIDPKKLIKLAQH